MLPGRSPTGLKSSATRGPVDIYAGVPTSMPLIDGTAEPELAKVLDAAAAARGNFDPYVAIVLEGGGMRFGARSVY